jgi:hypothetical protein
MDYWWCTRSLFSQWLDQVLFCLTPTSTYWAWEPTVDSIVVNFHISCVDGWLAYVQHWMMKVFISLWCIQSSWVFWRQLYFLGNRCLVLITW